MIDQSKAALEGKRAGGRARQQTSADNQQTSADNQQTAAEGQQESAECQQTAAGTSNIQELRIKTQDTRDKKQKNGGDKRARTRFTPPTAEEVRAYCAEKDLNVDPERFVAYYESNGWMVGRNHMKDWRAAARSWAQRDPPAQPLRTQGKVVREQQYTQREYVHNYDALNWLMSQPPKDEKKP